MKDRLFDIELGPTDEGLEVIEVSVYYKLGGISYASYQQEPRGYYVMIMPCVVGENFRTYAISANSRGFKQVIETTKRLNRKRLEWLRNAVEKHADRRAIKTLILSGDKANAFVEIMRAIELGKREAA